jgi:hypothetical protein
VRFPGPVLSADVYCTSPHTSTTSPGMQASTRPWQRGARWRECQSHSDRGLSSSLSSKYACDGLAAYLRKVALEAARHPPLLPFRLCGKLFQLHALLVDTTCAAMNRLERFAATAFAHALGRQRKLSVDKAVTVRRP